MAKRLVINLTSREKEALIKLAQQEFRDPRSQAALIIKQELNRLGILCDANFDKTEITTHNDDEQ